MRATLALCLLLSGLPAGAADAPDAGALEVQAPASTAKLKGVHFTGWAAGTASTRRRFIAEMKAGGFNGAAIALKDYDGRVFVKNVPLSLQTGAYLNAIPDLNALVKDFKDAGLYAIARVAVFKDDYMARKRPDLAVKFPDGRVWTNDKGTAWVDPYRREIWEYAVDIASRAAAAGFDEIQFDYIRFPSDGPTRQCRYSRADHSPATAAAALREFLGYARSRLKPMGVKISICTFGLTTTVDTGMGIGQTMGQMADQVDYVSPMMYPSHYARGEYGLRDPNRQPYLTIYYGIKDAIGRLGGKTAALRPYLQDFSLGTRYGPSHVRAQIRAAEEQGVDGWLLWNPQNRYNWSAIQAGPMAKSMPSPPKRTRKAPPPADQSAPPAPAPDTQGPQPPPAVPKPEE